MTALTPPAFELRIPTDADAEAWSTLFYDADVMRYIGDGRIQPLDWYRAFVGRQQELAAATGLCLFSLVRTDPSSATMAGPVAGFVGLQPWRQPWGPTGRLEIGWRLGREHQGFGLATAAARVCLLQAARAGIHDPMAMIDVENTPSIAVATKLGMAAEREYDSPTGARVAVYGFESAV